MSQTSDENTNVEKAILRAIDLLGDTKSVSVIDIQQYYLSKQRLKNMPDLKSIHLSLNSAVDKGHLKKLTNGKYKITETARSRLSRSRSRSRSKAKRKSRSRKRSGSRKRRRSSSGKSRKRSTSREQRSRRYRKKTVENGSNFSPEGIEISKS